ncbi:DUF3046 domain-containing protein [Arcanobacterium pinnipediorum]|uniref:DUF3046 domain-containing protein n=1 Tax=Arcanobacterium pinnipediorum TaxID=1503041 RepID=A0ABY5AJR2_9ACTO|nr:DUF3046 domain-containing protein [Arcanobacterium pinnipediorum]USR80006.1 DUF3046 domain-containing protein [Arcanobacterium pinnipediorum]
MKHTEFWQCVERAFPDGLGHGLVQDLVLPELGSRTAQQALEDHIDPQIVWSALRKTMDLPEKFDFLHKIHPRDVNLDL